MLFPQLLTQLGLCASSGLLTGSLSFAVTPSEAPRLGPPSRLSLPHNLCYSLSGTHHVWFVHLSPSLGSFRRWNLTCPPHCIPSTSNKAWCAAALVAGGLPGLGRDGCSPGSRRSLRWSPSDTCKNMYGPMMPCFLGPRLLDFLPPCALSRLGVSALGILSAQLELGGCLYVENQRKAPVLSVLLLSHIMGQIGF